MSNTVVINGEEIWKKIKDFEDYDVSNHGRIRKWIELRSGDGYYRYPSFSESSNGSLKVGLISDGRKTNGRQLAKIVYETFLGVETNEDIVYVDNDKTNCSLNNLWTINELVEIAKKHNELTRDIKEYL